jgi:hypothetical protein
VRVTHFEGRCPFIQKRSYYIHALIRRFAGAQIVSVFALGALVLTSAFSSHRDALRADLELAAGHMLWVFYPYAALVLFNLTLRLIPSTDIRSATSVLVLGPLTAIRPLIMIIGILYGISASHLPETRILGGFVFVLMLSFEFVLNRYADRIQDIRLRQILEYRG